jgi:hypothetical protein
MYSIVSYL